MKQLGTLQKRMNEPYLHFPFTLVLGRMLVKVGYSDMDGLSG